MLKCTYCGQKCTDEMAQCPICATPLKEMPPEVQPASQPVRNIAERQMRRGALWCIGGILVTGVTYANAANSPTGGTYFVAWGAIIFGALQFFRGWMHRGDPPVDPRAAAAEADKPEDVAYRELARATALEAVGNIPEALAAYQQLAEKYPHLEAGHDAAVSLKSLRERLG